jgi:hydroxymethylbilane synthase
MGSTDQSALRLGTRGSPLALWQARWVANELERLATGIAVEIVTIKTLAEKFPGRAVAEIGTGIFTRELDEALLAGQIDLAVHSLKDVPTDLDARIALAAIPERESPLDAFLAAGGTPLERLPPGAAIGTGSPRRQAQLLRFRPDLVVVPLRGNVATRLRKVEEQGLAGTVLAHAGLRRLGEEARVTHLVPPQVILPAVGQGALGIATLRANEHVLGLVARLDHADSRARVIAERGFLRTLRGGCQVPAGALAELVAPGRLRIDGVIAAPDGSSAVRDRIEGAPAEAEALGRSLAGRVLANGGAQILSRLRGS